MPAAFRGRELLSRFVSPVVMTPELEGPERRYRATGAFNRSFILTAAAHSEGREKPLVPAARGLNVAAVDEGLGAHERTIYTRRR
jgi:hypothetical protein